MIKRRIAGVGIIAMSLLAGITTAFGVEISEVEYGDRWPFTVASGDLECVTPSKVIFRAGGRTYAVNGTAGADNRFANIRPIWKDNPEIPGTKINIGPVINQGLTLCK